MSEIPGYVDLQVNGYLGVDFSSVELTADDFVRASESILANGTAVFLPTIITSSDEVYRRNLPLIRNAVVRQGLEKQIPGVHLEGPFISRTPGAVGCHNPDWVQAPSSDVFDRLYDYSGGTVKLITVAAGVPGIEDLISYIRNKSVAVSLGHQFPDTNQLVAAGNAGAIALTHFGNGLPNMLPRHDNPIWDSLAGDLSPMLITDGHHLPDNFIRCVIKMKGAENLVVVSDASPASGLPPGNYHVLGNDAVLDSKGKLYNPEKQCLVGSASNMTQCMKYLDNLNLLTDYELKLVGYYNPLKIINYDESEQCHV